MKRWTLTGLLLISVMLVLLLITPVYQAQETGEGFVYQLSGEVQVLRGPWWKIWGWQKLKPGIELLAGDRVKVGNDSYVEIELYNDTHIKLLENTLLVIGESEYLEYAFEQEEVRTSSIQVRSGQIWVKVEKAISKMLKFKVETPNSVAGVRGTNFLLKIAGKKTDLLVDEGLVEIYQISGGEGVLVSGGYQVHVNKGQQPTEPVLVTEKERQGLKNWVKQVNQEKEKRQEAKEQAQKLKADKFGEKEKKQNSKVQDHVEQKKENEDGKKDKSNQGKGSEDEEDHPRGGKGSGK